MKLEIVASNETSNLSLREADVAVRPTSTPDEHLVGRKLGVIRHAIYAQRSSYLSTANPQELKSFPWIGPSPSLAYSQLHTWMKRNGFDEACVCTADTVLGIFAAARAGTGLAVLPAYLAEQDEKLVRIGSDIAGVAVDLWLLTHPDMRQTARVRAVLDYFGESDLIRKQLAN